MQLQENRTFNHVHGTDKTMHNQSGTMLPLLRCFDIVFQILSLSDRYIIFTND